MSRRRPSPPRRVTGSSISLTLEGYLALAKLSICFSRPGHFWRNLSPELQRLVVKFEQEREEHLSRIRADIDTEMPTPSMDSKAFIHLAALEDALGRSTFKKHVGPELQEQMQEAITWAETSAMAKHMKQLLADPVVQKRARQFQRAQKGDTRAIRDCLERWPLTTLADETIADHVWRLQRTSGDPARLERLADAFRKGLLRPRIGRKPKEADRQRIRRFVALVQTLYEEEPRRLKPHYQGLGSMRRANDDFANRLVACLQSPLREETGRTIRELLDGTCDNNQPRRWKSGFGTAVAACRWNYSVRQVRTIVRS